MYGEKRVSVQTPGTEPGTMDKTEYRVWNPFRSKLAAAVIAGVDAIHVKPGAKVRRLHCPLTHLRSRSSPAACVKPSTQSRAKASSQVQIAQTRQTPCQLQALPQRYCTASAPPSPEQCQHASSGGFAHDLHSPVPHLRAVFPKPLTSPAECCSPLALCLACSCQLTPGLQVLYLGAASGTSVSHVSDIVGPSGSVYAVEFSHRSGAHLLLLPAKLQVAACRLAKSRKLSAEAAGCHAALRSTACSACRDA